MKLKKIWLGGLIANVIVKFKGKDANMYFFEKKVVEMFGKKIDSGTWETSDPKEVEIIRKDILNNIPFSAGFYQSLFANCLTLYNNLDSVSKDLPIGIFSGGNDPIGNYGKGVARLFDVYQKNKLNVKLVIYPNMRHHILHEKHRSLVYREILDFIKQ